MHKKRDFLVIGRNRFAHAEIDFQAASVYLNSDYANAARAQLMQFARFTHKHARCAECLVISSQRLSHAHLRKTPRNITARTVPYVRAITQIYTQTRTCLVLCRRLLAAIIG